MLPWDRCFGLLGKLGFCVASACLTCAVAGCRPSDNSYIVTQRIGPAKPSTDDVDVTLLHRGRELHVRCNNNKAGDHGEDVPCNLQVGDKVRCQEFANRLSADAGGYDMICGEDRLKGKLTTSGKKELLTYEREEQPYVLVRSQPTIHHYIGSPCGLWNQEECDKSEMEYTFTKGNTSTVARCQSWDPRGVCGGLQVGTTYHCRIEAADQFSSQSLACVGVGWLEIDSSEFRSRADGD